MKEITKFWREKIRKPVGNFIDEVDAKIDPDVGFLLYKISRISSLTLFLVIFPIVTLIIGVDGYSYIQGYDSFLTKLAFSLIVGFFWFFLFLAYGMWFYFSKWNDQSRKDEKERLHKEKREVKDNRRKARKEEKKLRKIQLGSSLEDEAKAS